MLGVFAPFSRGRKNLLACGGHPVGEEIDFSGFVCSKPAGDMQRLLFLLFLYISGRSFYRRINMFYSFFRMALFEPV